MKKIFLLVFLSVFSFATINAEVTWKLSEDGTLTISGTGDMVYSWSYNYDIKKVIIEKGITNISDNAFNECRNLVSVSIPNSVTKIEGYAFKNCSSLASVTIPNSVSDISFEAFKGCSGLTSITIPDGVTTIGDEAFSGCVSLTSITIPKSIISIGSCVFKNCYGLREIYSLNPIPPKANNESFNILSTLHINVFVPEGASEAYKYDSNWNVFANIYEIIYSTVLTPAEPITISDNLYDVNKGYYKENTVTYVREGAAISKDNYASFCLPFAVDPADAQFKAVYVPVGIALYNTETNTLRVGFYKAKDIIPAGTPFLARLDVDDKVEIKNALPVNYDANTPTIKAKTIRTFDFYERSGIMSENDSYSITFSGSYKKASPANACTFNTDGSAGPSASVSPFRAYISLSKNATNAKIIASFEDEIEATGIKELLITNDKSPVYDLNGRIVNENVQKSGIYIKNGKKYIK